MGNQKLGDRSSVPGQEPPVGSPRHAMVRRLDNFLRGEPLLLRRRRTTNVYQAGYLGDLQSHLTMQQKMTQQTNRVVVAAASLQKVKSGLQHRDLLRCELSPRDLRVPQPLIVGQTIRGHDVPSVLPDVWPRQYIPVGY